MSNQKYGGEKTDELASAVHELADQSAPKKGRLNAKQKLIRVIYLLSKKNTSERSRLIQQTIKGEEWTELTAKGKSKKITDKEMVRVANELQGWTQSVYKFGCAFIHLSNYHNYSTENPFGRLSKEEQKFILHHMRNYHGGPHDDNPSFDELSRYFPSVFQKINSNLECYIKDLEK